MKYFNKKTFRSKQKSIFGFKTIDQITVVVLISAPQKNAILCWINNGAPDN